MIKQLINIVLILFSINVLSQNLVYNGSFEQYDTCPSTAFQLNLANHWFSANWGDGGSSEYFNACDSLGLFGVPSNWFTYQYPRTGNGYTGTECFAYYGEGREYIEGTLKDSLSNGVQYCANFYVSLSSYSSYGIDALGLYFTKDSLITYSNLAYYVKPQIANDSLNIITDTTNWVKISGTFIAAGGERFFTFGNFKNNNQTNFINTNGIINGYAYYLMEDVAVYSCDAPVYFADAGGDKIICPDETINIGMQNYDEYIYRWYNANGSIIDTTASISIRPGVTTTYILWVEDFKYEITTDTVTVFIDEGCGESPVVFIPNIFTPNLDGNNDVLYVRSEHIKELNFSVYNRWGEKVFESQDQNNGWDGNYKGKQCQPGVYYYMADITFTNGETLMKKGNVTLVR